jgi:hypothetical protein
MKNKKLLTRVSLVAAVIALLLAGLIIFKKDQSGLGQSFLTRPTEPQVGNKSCKTVDDCLTSCGKKNWPGRLF